MRHTSRAYNLLGVSLLSRSYMFRPSVKAPGVDRQKMVAVEAEAAFRKVLALTDGQANIAWYNLGEVLKLRRRDQEALSAFAEYLERQPDGERAAQARSVMDWIACAQSVGYSEPRSNDDPEISSEGEPSGPFRVGGNVKAPEKIRAPNPQYTEKARKAQIQGTMIFEALIDKKGAVRCLNILKGLPMGLSEAAAAVLATWRFKPATLDGEPVVVIYMLTVTMSLQ